MSLSIDKLRLLIAAVISAVVVTTPVRAHHQSRGEGPTVGVEIPAIAHDEMPIIDKYRAEILDLASRQPRTDLTLRRLVSFVSLQYFVCFWGLIPGTVTDETNPLNECSHAYLAGARALLAHMATMPGDQRSAKALKARIEAELANDPIASTLCSNSGEVFDSGIIVTPDWTLALSRLSATRATIASLALISAAAAWLGLCLARRRPVGPDLRN